MTGLLVKGQHFYDADIEVANIELRRPSNIFQESFNSC